MAVIIATASKVVDKHGTDVHGFTSGNPQAGVAATELSDDWCDGVQQEINNTIELYGDPLDNTDRTQLSYSIDQQIRYRQPRFGGYVVDTWCSEPSPASTDWLRRERSTGLLGVANNTVQNMLAMTMPSNSQATLLLRGSVIQADSNTNYTNYAVFVSVRNSSGTYTVQSTGTAMLNDNVAGVTITCVIIGAAIYMRFSLPVLAGKFFNIFATGVLENVSRT